MVLPLHWSWGHLASQPVHLPWGSLLEWQRCGGAFIGLSGIVPRGNTFIENVILSSSHVQMWELDHKEDWAPKNWCFGILVQEKTRESPLNSREIKPVSPKGNQLWILIGRTDAEAEAPIFWPLGAKNQLIGKDPDAGKDWGQEEKGVTEDEMVGWHHWLNGHEFEQALGDAKGQGDLACYSPLGHKELDTT